MSAEIDTLKQQMMELQSQFAFQEDAVGSLDAALAQQQQEILLLRRQVELLRQRQLENEAHAQAGSDGSGYAAVSTTALDEKPPHY
jgi:SlyX protein